MNDRIIVKKLDERAALPQRATEGSAGYDLCAVLDSPVVIAPGQTVSISTKLAVQPPDGCAVFVFGRSGLGVRHGIAPANAVGVIDPDYRGEIIVGLHNHSQTEYTISHGDRIAQMVIMPIYIAQVVQAEQLTQTARDAGGFGSTGKR